MQSDPPTQSPLRAGRGLGACCLSLLRLLNGQVHVPGSLEYNASLASYFAQQESSIHPLCVVQPRTADDVSAAVRVISNTARTLPDQDQQQCHFAVRSGGHAVHAGAANIDGGVTIDLRMLDSVSVSDDETALVGPGATWDQVYRALEPHGLSAAGGRTAGVGVGGLTTGGGISFFSPRYGWTFDSALSFDVVLANGTAVRASAQEHPDLLFALRGGSGNFGIVTGITFQTFRQGPLWGGIRFYSLSTLEAHLRAFVEFAAAETYDVYASLITNFILSSGQPPAIATNMEYSAPLESPPALQAVAAIPALQSTMRIANMSDLALELLSVQAHRHRQLTVQTTYSPTLPMLEALFRRWNASLSSVEGIPDMTWALSLEPLPPCIYARNARSNALGLGDRSGSLVVTLITASWADTADDARVTAAARSLMAHIEGDARSLGAYDPFVYLNYAAPWQDPIASYGASSLGHLRDIRRQVDPDGLFTRGTPGGFKIPA